MAFFKGWVSANARQGYISYDVTSLSSYAEGVRDLEWGYNRDGDKLPQINLGCYLAQENRLPMFYVTYPGSIVDKSHLPYMMAYNDELDIGEDIVFVMDRGFCSTSNVIFMHSEGISYIIGADARCKAARAAINGVRDRIVSLRNLAGEGTYAVAVRSRFYGGLATMHIYINPELGERQRRDFLRTIKNMEDKLAQMHTVTDKELKHFARFFDIQINDGHILFTRNYDKIDEASKNSGVFCILTNTSLTSREVLDYYRKKDTIEKGFDDIKNHLDMKRMRVHTDAAVDGKLFCAFIALIAASEISNCLDVLNETINQCTLSKRGLFSELEKIKVFVSRVGKCLVNPLTKLQRTILDSFNTCDSDLLAYIENVC
jgi:transposase